MSDDDVADVADAHGGAVIAGHHDRANILGIAGEAQSPHVVELPALGVKAAARVGIVHGQGLNDLGNGEVKTIKPCGIEQHLILHHRAAKA